MEPQSAKPRQSSYNTNLASEFYALSLLHRLGIEAHLTLGNKKAVDIVVVREAGDTVTVDVKAVAGSVDWLVGNVPRTARPQHFIALLTYNGKFKDIKSQPDVWLLPHTEFLVLVRTARAPSTMKYVSRTDILKLSNREQAWDLLLRGSTDSALPESA